MFVDEYVRLLKRQQKIEVMPRQETEGERREGGIIVNLLILMCLFVLQSMRTKYSGERNTHMVVDTTLVVTLTYCCRYHYSEPDVRQRE